jgi:hypothetical protein
MSTRRSKESKGKTKTERKGKKLTPEMSLENLKAERMKIYHEATLRKAEAVEKAAAVTKENAKCDMLDKYLNLMAGDTTGYSDKRKQRHESVLNYLQSQLFHEEQ